MSHDKPVDGGTGYTDTQWKAEGGDRREQKPLNALHIMLLLPATPTNKRYHPQQVEFHACASIPKPLTMIGRDRS